MDIAYNFNSNFINLKTLLFVSLGVSKVHIELISVSNKDTHTTFKENTIDLKTKNNIPTQHTTSSLKPVQDRR